MIMSNASLQLNPVAAAGICSERNSKRVLMRAANLKKSFGGQVVLKDVSLELHEGECVALIGPNGSGKTTLENILSGNLEPDSGTIELLTNGASERFTFPRSVWQNANPLDHFTPERLAWEGVSKTWQEVRLFSTQSLLDNIAVAAPKQLGENPLRSIFWRGSVLQQERANQAAGRGILAKLGLGERAASSADKISLGQSKRIAIARAVHSGARILFLDEPLAGLDSAGIREVFSLLKELLQERRLTLVIIEHAFNLPHVLDLVTQVWRLEDGEMLHEEASSLRSRVFQNHGNDSVKLVQRIVGTNAEIRDEHLAGGAVLSKISRSVGGYKQPALDVEELVVYRGKRLVVGEQLANGDVRGMSFHLAAGEVGCLQAPNGWGKTSLIEAIAGILPIRRGKIRILGRPIHDLEPWERVRMGLTTLQSRSNCFSSLTVRESLLLSGANSALSDLEDLLDRHVSDLSGGERQRLALACVSHGETKVGLYDEPFSALDADSLQGSLVAKSLLGNQATLVSVPSSI